MRSLIRHHRHLVCGTCHALSRKPDQSDRVKQSLLTSGSDAGVVAALETELFSTTHTGQSVVGFRSRKHRRRMHRDSCHGISTEKLVSRANLSTVLLHCISFQLSMCLKIQDTMIY